ncbi:MAG: heavy metal translocating P-type ATPase [Defluviitaleaceae bacterium]|nr:heavy metal translocating P-type ATPase [Defluviitaleaceae bacterium]
MKKAFILQGLNCPHCAANIEKSLNKAENISAVSLNLSTSTLYLEYLENSKHSETADAAANIHDVVEKIVHEYESDILVTEKKQAFQATEQKSQKKTLVWLAASTVIFVAGIVFYNINNYASIGLFTVSYLLLGANVLWAALKNILKGNLFDENFLMGIATIGAFVIGEFAGAATVMLLYQIGEFFQNKAVRASKKGISDLMDIRSDYANLLQSGESGELEQNGQTKRVSPESVAVGETIIIKPGEKIPLDGVILAGEAMLDTSALTGESVPRKVAKNDAVLSGCINQNGVLTVKVTQTFGESTASKILDLVENAASKKAKLETFITKFAKWYTPTVVILAVLLAVVPPLFFGGIWQEWIYRAIILLIISCPCALVLSIPLGFFGGIGASSKKGILVKGGNFLEALSSLDTVVFDKTGTLTKGVFKVTSIQPAEGFTAAELLQTASFAESFSSHPIAVSICKEYAQIVDKSGSTHSTGELSDYNEISGYGVSVLHKNGQNRQAILAGNEKLMRRENITFVENTDFGTKVYVARDNIYMGSIVISDEIKPDSKAAITQLKNMGVRRIVMLTGDTQKVAENVANQLGIDEVHFSLLPQEKVEKLETYAKEKQPKKSLAFVGDGINDAPVLAMADVGIAMGGLGSDAAIEAADVVLMTDEPQKLGEAITVARFTRKIVWQNIVGALGVQLIFIVLGTMGVASIWEAIFADVGVSLLAVLNTLRILRI